MVLSGYTPSEIKDAKIAEKNVYSLNFFFEKTFKFKLLYCTIPERVT